MNIEKLRALWDGHAKAVHIYLLRLTRSEADASDFLQDVFCRLARQPELLERLNGDARGWLLRMARNAVVDQVRRGQALERVFAKINAARPDEMVDAEDPDLPLLRAALSDALRQLPEEQRAVVLARLWKRRTLEDIATELGISINTAASRYRYGLDKMREALRSLYEDFAPRASTQLKPTMKPTSKNPFAKPEIETPIIQPLEQRRVPSATGAALALPILPAPDEHADAPAETEIPVDVGTDAGVPADPTGDTEVVIDDGDFIPLPDDAVTFEVTDTEVPVTFEDFIAYADKEVTDEVVDPAVDVIPDAQIFWTFAELHDAGGEETTDVVTLPGDEGEVGGVDPVIDLIPVDKDGGEVHDDGEVIDASHDEPPVEKDGEGIDQSHDDGSVEKDGSGNGGIVPIEWVKRGGGALTGEETGEGTDGPQVIYYMTGAPMTAAHGGFPQEAAHGDDHAVEATPEAAHTPVDHAASGAHAEAADHDVAAHHEAAPLPPVATAPQTGSESATIELNWSNHAPAAVEHSETLASVAHFDVHAPAVGAETSEIHADSTHDLGSLEHHVTAPLETTDSAWHSADADHGNVAAANVNEWVPLHDLHETSHLAETHSDTPLVTPATIGTEHVAPADAGAIDGGHAGLGSGAAAMAATGAVLAASEPLKRRRKELE
jgi:RNA polymerase sigma-70 factor (ECF subfamily)